jgi:TonB family protein
LVTKGGKENYVALAIVVDRTGNVTSISVKTPGNDPDFDRAIMESIRKGGLPAPPQGAPRRINLEIYPLLNTRAPDSNALHAK